MKNFIEKEYHPVIENFLNDYIDDTLGPVERNAFDEVLVNDDDLRDLAFNAKGGKEIMEKYADATKVSAKDDFLKRLRKRIAEES